MTRSSSWRTSSETCVTGCRPWRQPTAPWNEVGGALISIALTLCAVFVPSAFISGISGLFFTQFAVTIAASTVISCFVSLTLSPSLCAVLFKSHDGQDTPPAGVAGWLLQGGFARFNRGFEWVSTAYGNLTRRLVRALALGLAVYVGLIAFTGVLFSRMTGFIPEQDQGLLLTIIQLPPGATLARTEKVVMEATDIILTTPGIEHVAPFPGLDVTTSTVASNGGTIFVGLPSLYNHSIPGVTATSPREPLVSVLGLLALARRGATETDILDRGLRRLEREVAQLTAGQAGPQQTLRTSREATRSVDLRCVPAEAAPVSVRYPSHSMGYNIPQVRPVFTSRKCIHSWHHAVD
jgi:multidrug efflux pump subunit AcrB